MKRFIAIILAVAMCISLLPIATSVAIAAENENEFVFTCKAYGTTSAVKWADLAAKKLSDVDSDSSDPWRTATSYYGTSIMARESGFRFVAKTARATSGIGVVGMELDVSLDGSVTPTFTYIARASAPIVDVYLVKADVTGPLNSKGTTTGTPADFVMPTTGNGTGDSYYFLKSLGSAYKLGTVDMYASEVTEKSVVFDNFELSGEGSYYLLINSVGTNASYVAYGSSNEYEAEIVSLKLTGESEEAVMKSVSLVSESSALTVSGEMKVSATAAYSDDTTAPLTSGITYKSSDENVVTVSEDGTVTGIGEGRATITVEVSGTLFSDSVDVIVTSKQSFVFKNAALGTADAYNWAELATKTLADVNLDVSFPWRPATMFYGRSLFARESGFRFVAYTARATGKIGTLGMELDVGIDGSIVPTLTYMARPSAPIIDVYLVKDDVTGPLNAKGTTTGTPADFVMPASGNGTGDGYYFMTALGESYKLGTVDMYASTECEKTVVFDEFELSGRGSYYLLIHTVGTNENYVAYGSKDEFEAEISELELRMKSDAEIVSVDLSADSESILLGGKAVLSVTATLSDNTTTPLSDGVTYNSSDKNVASVAADGTVSALAIGKATITASVDGTEISDSVEIEVKPQQMYVFGRDAYASIYDIAWASLPEMKLSDIKINVSKPWRPAAAFYARDVKVTSNGLYYNAAHVRATSGIGSFAAELDIVVGGKVAPTIGYIARPSAPVVDVYLVKSDVEGKLNSKGTQTGTPADFVMPGSGNGSGDVYYYINDLKGAYKLGTIDMYASKEEAKVITFDEYTLTGAGSYYILFHTVGLNDSFEPDVDGSRTNLEAEISSLILSSGAPVDGIGSLSLSSKKTSLLVGNTAKLSATARYFLSGTKSVENEVDYKSSDENVVKVSADGTVTATGAGTATVTATVKGSDVSDSVSFSVRTVNPASAEYTYDFTRKAYSSDANVIWKMFVDKTFDDVNPDVSAPWKTATAFYANDLQVREKGFYFSAYSVRALNTSVGSFGIEIKVDEGGGFFPSISYVAKRSAPIVDVYLVKEDVKAKDILPTSFTMPSANDYGESLIYTYISALDDSYKLGTIDMYSENECIKRIDFQELELDGNCSYFVLFRTVGLNEMHAPSSTPARYLEVEINSFGLKPKAGSFEKVKISDSGSIAVSEMRELAFEMYDTNDIRFNKAEEIDADKFSAVYSSSNEDVATVSQDGIITALTAGETTIGIAVTYDNVTSYDELLFKVSPVSSKYELVKTEIELEKTEIDISETTAATVSGIMSDGSYVDMSKATVAYESITPDVVLVDEDGNITPMRAGSGRVCAALTYKGVTIYATAEITVRDSTKIESAKLSEVGTVGYLRDECIVITGMMESGCEADFKNAEIKWIITSDPVGGISVDADGNVFGEILGAVANIKAEITLGGATVMTNAIDVEVVETDSRDFAVNFANIPENMLSDVTMEKYGWEHVTENAHYSLNSSSFARNFARFTLNDVSSDFVIDFNVPYSGNYSPEFISGFRNGYGAENVRVYLDGVYIGEYEFFADSARIMIPEKMRALSLSAGTHRLTFRPDANQRGSKSYYLYPRIMSFMAIDALPGAREINTEKEDYTICVGGCDELSARVVMADGYKYAWQEMLDGNEDSFATVIYSSNDENVVIVDEKGKLTAVSVGNAEITIMATVNGNQAEKVIPVSVVAEGTATDDNTLATIEITAPFFTMNPETEGVQLSVSGKSANGTELDMTDAELCWEAEEEGVVVSLSESGYVSPLDIGCVKITLTATLDGITRTCETYISVREGKVGRTYYTDEMVEAAQENVKKYSWAKDECAAALKKAEKYLGLAEVLWSMVPGEGIPRSNSVGFDSDPNRAICKYCGVDISKKYSLYGWVINPLNDPWKVQCPDCKRTFPSNDFGSFYELGLDEHGIFNRELALARHEEMFGGTYGTGYLKNEQYPEIGTSKHPSTVTFSDWETSETWGVDDGYGYDTGRVYSSGDREVHTYIAYYMNWGLWHNGLFTDVLDSLTNAYLYTGDEKYGRIGAIFLDRIADVYPDYDNSLYDSGYSIANGGNAGAGKIVGRIWDLQNAGLFARAYDAFFPMYDDSRVVSFLSTKAIECSNTELNDKTTPEKIRENIENGILREIFNGVQNADILGNFGAHQASLAQAAVVLDTHPDTDDMIDWLWRESKSDYKTYNTGGEVFTKLINDVSRDGQGNESAPGYNRIWVTNVASVADSLVSYDEYEGANLYENPKFIAMINSYAPLTLVRRGLAPIGDSGAPGRFSLLPDEDSVMIKSFKETGNVEIAQHLYFIKDGELDDIHYDIFTKNPESLSDDVNAIIEKYGEYDYDKSSMLTGYGFGALRDGTYFKGVNSGSVADTQRDFWIYFGGAQSHSHNAALNLGIEAWGLPMTTDLGYPETADADPNRNQWQNVTLSHNTVVVNEDTQETGNYNGTPLHFDDKDTRVKVIDVDASVVYTATDEYRRTVVMVDYDDEISYGIDFFKVRGGNDHLYSFHATSEEDPKTSENLAFRTQATGSYADPSVPYGEDPWSVTGDQYVVLKYPDGYTWLDDVKRADNPRTGEFYVDWKIKDFWKQSRNASADIRLRMTAVNDWEADEVTLVNGMPPRTGNNLRAIDHLEYMLIRRKGHDLNTLFTTVVEPYSGSRYIKSIENIPVTLVEGTPGKNDVAKAVKVELVDGRCDYIVYAQNNNVTYNVGGLFTFRGFIGVRTLNADGKNIYSYINDGYMIGTDDEMIEAPVASIGGTITDFERNLSFENCIYVEFDRELTQEDAKSLAGRLVNVERKELGNSSYVIKSVELEDSTHGTINFGNVSLINSYIDPQNPDKGYNYDVAIGRSIEIPMSYEENYAPAFKNTEELEELSVTAGSSITVKLSAVADERIGNAITYAERNLPRGAVLSADGTINWKPGASQVGVNLFAVDAVDEDGRRTTQYFTVTVYGSTTGAGSGGAGGGGGGAAPAPSKPVEDDKKEDVTTPTTPSTPAEDENVRFIDLGAHSWAADAINALAEDGIIKGTSENAFSPASNITRADFALLLVRAFKLESENTENFADVAGTDYFAKELAIARNTGIAGGIGDNKYAPKNTITRQDMMTIVYRAMQKLDVEFSVYDEPQYDDFANVADYAKDAVKTLIGAGLVNGKSGKIAPEDYTTRAEVAVLIKRILNYIG